MECVCQIPNQSMILSCRICDMEHLLPLTEYEIRQKCPEHQRMSMDGGRKPFVCDQCQTQGYKITGDFFQPPIYSKYNNEIKGYWWLTSHRFYMKIRNRFISHFFKSQLCSDSQR